MHMMKTTKEKAPRDTLFMIDLSVSSAMGEAENALGRLLTASRKTRKLVNALKYNIIPRYQATVQHIRAALEENERNTPFQIKVPRARQPA